MRYIIMMKSDGIIFDLDGTLWDATGSVINSWNETIGSYREVKNRLTVDDMRSVMGLIIEDIALKFFPYLEEENRLKIIRHCSRNECKHLEKNGGILYGGLEETLDILTKKYKLFIVSNCQSGYMEAFFKYHRLDKYFMDYEVSGGTERTKGENIKLLMERNNLSNPVYVGDAEGDLRAARFAGIPFIYARYGFGEVNGYDYVIDSFCDLLKLL